MLELLESGVVNQLLQLNARNIVVLLILLAGIGLIIFDRVQKSKRKKSDSGSSTGKRAARE